MNKINIILTNTNIGGNPTNINVSTPGFLDQIRETGLAKLRIVKEGRVGVDIRIYTFVYNMFSRM